MLARKGYREGARILAGRLEFWNKPPVFAILGIPSVPLLTEKKCTM